jgi:hypothetical protein
LVSALHTPSQHSPEPAQPSPMAKQDAEAHTPVSVLQ